MTAKEFLESKGFDDLREGLYHVFEQDEIELLLNEFAALPCSCEGGHYGYGAAKCFVCGRVKEVEKDGHFPAVSGSSLPLKIERIIAVVAQRWGKEYGGSTAGILGQDAIEICEKYGIDWENYH